MPKSVLLGVMCMVWASTTDAQNYLPLLGEPTRMWTSEMNGSSDGYCLETWRSTNWIAGDTVINGTSYTRLHRRERHYLTPIMVQCFDMQEYWQPDVYVREEDGEVYALDYWQTTEYLIYDFNATIGDTVPFPSNAGTVVGLGGLATVLGKDSVLIDGGYRTRWNVNSEWNGPDTVYVIEGIGSTTGLFNPLVYMDFETSFLLNCVYEHGETIFHQYNGCELINGIPALEPRTIVPPYPDPTPGDITLSDQVTRARIVSMDGRTLFDGPCKKQVVHLDASGAVIVLGFAADGSNIGQWKVTVLRP